MHTISFCWKKVKGQESAGILGLESCCTCSQWTTLDDIPYPAMFGEWSLDCHTCGFAAKHLWNQSLMKPLDPPKQPRIQKNLKGCIEKYQRKRKSSTNQGSSSMKLCLFSLMQEWGSEFFPQQRILDSPTMRINHYMSSYLQLQNPSMKISIFSSEMRFWNGNVQDGIRWIYPPHRIPLTTRMTLHF